MSEAVITESSADSAGKQGSVLGGTVIVAGTAIGAGMFSLPVATSGLWFGYSMLLMVFTWYCMYSAALYLLEANLRFPLGASFDSIAEGTIGSIGRVVNGASVAFLCYILTYAYISGGSSIITYSLEAFDGVSLSPPMASFVFALVLSAIVVTGTRAVDRVSTVLIGGMVITFLWSISGLLSNASSDYLMPGLSFTEVFPFSFGALGFLTVSFGMQTAVPSITRYLNKDGQKVRFALLVGSLLALAFYALWQFSFFGNLPREAFPAIIAAGGNIGDMLGALSESGLNMNLSSVLQWFANMAVASSFLGVALCLFDYIADLFGFDNSFSGRLKTAAITFIPPTLLGVFLPNGFITAIGFAGLVLVIFCILSPVVMAWIGRQRGEEGYQVPGGILRMALIFLFGIAAMVLAGLDLVGVLPKFG
ncbi:amino acid permease [Endozoicomonas elysicola]|uniref:amino acid permease n=1 Tax=Endozoicomonas elysicola TaxID=305900 RepID=UPI0003603025|nr:aromatic amino acid transport family protein [Endozoicomonas elysicola]